MLFLSYHSNTERLFPVFCKAGPPQQIRLTDWNLLTFSMRSYLCNKKNQVCKKTAMQGKDGYATTGKLKCTEHNA